MKPRMHDHFIGSLVGVRLKFQSEPAMPLDGFVEVDRGNRIRESKEVLVGVIIAIKPFLHKVILVFEHFLDTALAHIAAVLFFTVNRI